MLTRFYIDDQLYEHVGKERIPTRNGRHVNAVRWQSVCPDCGQFFVQTHRYAGFIPHYYITRRCRPCRRGPGKRVTQRTGPATSRQPPAHGSPTHPPKTEHTASAPLSLPPTARKPGVFTDR